MYSKLYRNMLFPFYETFLKKRKTLVYLEELEESQWFREDKLKEIQWVRLKTLLEHAYENVPYYHELFEKKCITPEDINGFEDFRKLPLLTKDVIRMRKNDLIARNYKRTTIADGMTGGSTGTPLKFKLDNNNYRWRRAAVNRVYGWAGYKDGEKTIFIWGASVVKQSFFKKIKHDLDEWLKRHKIYNTFYFSEEMMDCCLKEINRYKPTFIIAYTTPLYNFARYIKANNKNIKSPRAIIAAAEKLFPQQRKTIEAIFCCPVFETYGCREVTSIAGECEKHKGMHINMETIYLEVVKEGRPAEPGETGEIVITDLTNYAMPFIRYKNDDVGSVSNRKCDCGRGLSLIESIEGRILDTIKTRDGRLIPGEFFIYWFMGFDGIKQFQIFQKDLDNLIVKIVKNKDFPQEKLYYLEDVIRRIMGDEISVDFQIVDEIPLTGSGKFKVVVSEVPINFEKVIS